LGPVWLELGDGEIPLPLVYIDDVVDGVLAALRGPLRGGEVVQLVDPDSRTQNQVLEAMVGSEAKVVRIPRWLIFGAAGASERLLGLAGRTSPASTYRFRSGLAKRSFTSARAGQMLGWAPRVGVAEGLRRAAADLAAEKPTGGVRPPRA
jgi:nucleoside-diphosphate-sugar epimerase